jgi:hypothetical protein
MTNKLREILERFAALPDEAVVPSKVTAIILGISERVVRYHPMLPRAQISVGGIRPNNLRLVRPRHTRRGS